MKKLCLHLALAASVLSLTACGGGGGGFAPIVAPVTPPIQAAVNARYQIVLKDIATDLPITDPLVLAFSGAAPVKAADGSSLNGKSVTTSAGFYGIDVTFNGSDDATVKVTDADAKGWVATGVTLTGEAGAKGDRVVELKLLNVNKAAAITASAAPVAATTRTTTVAANGATTAPLTVTTPAKTVTTEEGTTEPLPTVQLAMPAGTIGTTASGQPAAAGQLTVASAVFSNANVESLQAFPGGFAPNIDVAGNAALLNGATAANGAVVTSGFAEFTVLDSAGNQIRNFSRPITISFDLAKGGRDGSGNPIVVGTQIPIWSFNEARQTWVFEKMGTVAEKAPVDPNFFTVNFQTTHLSFWSWFFWRPTCDPTITITGRPAGDARTLVVDVVGTEVSPFWSTGITSGNSVAFTRVPLNATATVTVRDKGFVVGQVKNRAICGGVTVPVTFRAAATGTVRFETSESCADGTSQRAVPTYVNVIAGSQFTPAYTSVVVGDVAIVNVPGQSTGQARVSAVNPRSGGSESLTVTVPANGTVTAPFNFTMSCSPVTGGG